MELLEQQAPYVIVNSLKWKLHWILSPEGGKWAQTGRKFILQGMV